MSYEIKLRKRETATTGVLYKLQNSFTPGVPPSGSQETVEGNPRFVSMTPLQITQGGGPGVNAGGKTLRNLSAGP